MTFAFNGQAQSIKDDQRNDLLYIDGTKVKTQKWGSNVKYEYHNNAIYEKHKYGKVLFYVDGNSIKQGSKYGKEVMYIEDDPRNSGNLIIKEVKYSSPKYYVEGSIIKERDKYGKVVKKLTFEPNFTLEPWILVCIMYELGLLEI